MKKTEFMGKSQTGAASSGLCKDSKRGTRLPALSEAHLERQCSDFLALDGWRTLKTDPVSRREWGKGFGEKGMADRLYLRYDFPQACKEQPELRKQMSAAMLAIGDVLWIEWKRIGGKAKPHQRLWIAAERARGGLVLLAGEDFPATYDGFLAWYRASGLLRRTGP